MITPKHSNLGPSSAERWWNCPGSVAASAPMPAPSPSRAAAEGTVAHGLCESVVTGDLSKKALDKKLFEVVLQDNFDILVDASMIDAVLIYEKVISGDALSLVEKYGKIPDCAAEKRVVVKSISQKLYGTADYVLYIVGKSLKIYDFKYGKKTVNPEENKQLAIYVLGVLDELGIGDENWEEIELVIVQPRAGGKAIRRWNIPKGWVTGFREELALAVAATQNPKAELRTGAWCYWCPASMTCPEKAKERAKSAAEDFA